MSEGIQKAIEEEIKKTHSIFETIKKSLDTSYKVIEDRNVYLVNLLKETFEGIIENNDSAKKFSTAMSGALNELIATQQTLETKIKLARGQTETQTERRVT